MNNTLIVAVIRAETCDIGEAFEADSWEDAYSIAESMVLNLYDKQGINFNNPYLVQEFRESLQQNNYYKLGQTCAVFNPSKTIAVQIISINN